VRASRALKPGRGRTGGVAGAQSNENNRWVQATWAAFFGDLRLGVHSEPLAEPPYTVDWPRLLRFVRRVMQDLVPAAELDDPVADVVVQIVQRIRSGPRIRKLDAYVRACCIGCAARWFRSNRVQFADMDLLVADAAPVGDYPATPPMPIAKFRGFRQRELAAHVLAGGTVAAWAEELGVPSNDAGRMVTAMVVSAADFFREFPRRGT